MAIYGKVGPNIGSVIFGVSLVEVLFLAEGYHSLFRDSDAGWHIRAGEMILRNIAVPRVDTFSYTHAGEPWYAWEWLADILYGGAHLLAGPAGVAMLASMAIALAVWGSARLALALGGNLFFTIGATVLVLVDTSIHWLARPHIFSWLLALAFVAIAEFERRAPTRAIFLLPVLACIWVNIHGSFLFGPGVLLLYALGEWLNEFRAAGFRFRAPVVSANQNPRAGLRLASASLASLLATFVNPYGWHVHTHVVGYLRDAYLMDHISEFRSFNFHGPAATYIEILLLVAAAGGLVLWRQRAYGPALLTFGMLHLSLFSARHLPTAAVILLPLAVVAFTRESERLPSMQGFLNYSNRLLAIDKGVAGVVPVLVLLLASAGGLAALARNGKVGFDAILFPTKAANYLESRGLQNHVFARDQWGGYLIYRFSGRLKVFIDGRSDFFGRDLLDSYGQAMDVKPGWESVLSANKVRFVLVPPDHVLAGALSLKPEWKRVYSDSVASVFERIT